MTINSDILIIGGGISGLLTARELLLAGRDVTIIDKAKLGQESSWAGGGILLPIYPWRLDYAISQLVIPSLNLYSQLQQALLQATGIDPEWQRCGMLICKNPDLDAAQAWCLQHDMLNLPASVEAIKPFSTNFLQPTWLPDIGQIRNPRLLQALTANLSQLGVKFIEEETVAELMIQDQRISHVRTNRSKYSLNELVICSGAWTANLLDALIETDRHAPRLPIKPIKGQMLLFGAEPETLSCMVLDDDHYLIPRRDGKILAGSTVESVGFDKQPTELAKHELYQFATQLFPKLNNYPVIHHWAGLRPGTPDGVPFISRHPAYVNLSVNAGHFRNGLVMGPASAMLMADILLNRPPIVDPTPYAIN